MKRNCLLYIIYLVVLGFNLIFVQCKKEVDPNMEEIHSDNGNAQIGRAGGIVRLNEIELTIPPNALSETYQIKIERKTSLRVGNLLFGPTFTLTPDWITFNEPVKIRIDLSGSKITDPALFQIINKRYLKMHGGIFNSTENTIEAEVSHFSEWAVQSKSAILLDKNKTYTFSIAKLHYPVDYPFLTERDKDLNSTIAGAFNQWQYILRPLGTKFHRLDNLTDESKKCDYKIFIANDWDLYEKFGFSDIFEQKPGSIESLPSVSLYDANTGEWLILLNQYMQFKTSSEIALGDSSGEYMMEQFLLHEIGHTLGLIHSIDSKSIMYNDQKGRFPGTLSQDDISQLAQLYQFGLEELHFSNASQMQIISEMKQIIPPLKSAEAAPTVKITDNEGNGVPGISVIFRMSHKGILRNPVAQTDEEGIASCGYWITAESRESQTLEALVGGFEKIIFSVELIDGEGYFPKESGTFIDDRDKQEYRWIKIGKQIWMAENLNVGVMIPGRNDARDNNVIEKYCIDDLEINGEKYGGLYQWNEMMNYQTGNNLNPSYIQGICPQGWHIPSDEEWIELERYLGIPEDELYYRGLISRGKIGNLLRSNNGWIEDEYHNNYQGMNSFGFNILPAGGRVYWNPDSPTPGTGGSAYFWTCTRYSDDFGIYRGFDASYNLLRGSTFERYGCSVRCVKD